VIRAPSIRDTTGFALARVCKAHRGNVAEVLAGAGLHVGQEMVLVELWEEDGLRGGELAARLRVEPPTVTKMLRRLENCGLVERRRDPEDARSFRVHITDEGQALRESVSHLWQRAEEKTLAGLGVEERRALHAILTKMRGSLDRG
jgi:DNA-binding MarR family transcriptional regulator